MTRPDHACPVIKNIVLLTLQIIIQTACAGTVCSGYWTMCQMRTCFIVRTIVDLLGGLFPVADRAGRRTRGP